MGNRTYDGKQILVMMKIPFCVCYRCRAMPVQKSKPKAKKWLEPDSKYLIGHRHYLLFGLRGLDLMPGVRRELLLNGAA